MSQAASTESMKRAEPSSLTEPFEPRQLWRRLAQLGLIVVLIALLVSALPELDDLRDRLAGASYGWIALVVAAEAASVLSFVAVFRGVFCTRMSWRFSGQLALSEQAVNVLVPAGGTGGLALGAWALNRGGMSASHIARRSVAFFLVTSLANFGLVVVAGAGLALGFLPGEAPLALTAGPAALSVAAIVAVSALPRVLRRLGTKPARGRAGHAIQRAAQAVGDGVTVTGRLLREGRPSVIGGAAGYVLFDIAALLAALHAVGYALPVGVFMLAYLIGQLGGLVPVPGGIGGTDGALVAALVVYGAPLAAAAAAVLVYRAFQLGLPALVGAAAFVRLRRTLAREEAPAGLCEPVPG
jgi:uncharacterized membrane protein YbhN (UPF0104 family)